MRAPKRVLVVEDDDSIRDFMKLALGDEGYDVLTAEDGALALRAARETRLDLILLDMRMAGVDGQKFAAEYRTLPGPHAPIVVVTAARSAAASAAEIGADGYLGKPFNLADLLALVRRFAGTP
jgi:DNA-binding response OmpR family regulator